MTTPNTHVQPDPPDQARHWGWQEAWLLIGLVLLLRVVFLLFVNRLELVGDEAQYWDWARRLDWSYYTKGPGVAWTIWASIITLGSHDWAVRLPAAVAGAVAMAGMAGFAWEISGKNPRAAFYGAAVWCLFFITIPLGLLITIDGPYLACWVLASWAGWRAFDAVSRGESGIRAWLWLGLFLGAGFLYKYTILLMVPGFVAYAVWSRKELRWSAKSVGGMAGCLGVFVLFCLPVVLWNANHDWVTVRHLLGHLQVKGGDTTVRTDWSYNPMTTVMFFLTQLAVVGPFTVALILLALRHTRRALKEGSRAPISASGLRYLIACALPVLLFYFVISFKKEIEANWPIGGYVTLLVLVAVSAPAMLDEYRAKVAQWIARGRPKSPRLGYLSARPETPFQLCWHWAVGMSVVTALGIFLLGAVVRVPGTERVIPTWRFAGYKEAGQAVSQARDALAKETGQEPFIMASGYELTGLIGMYTPGQPRVVSGASRIGQRESSYDYFPDTTFQNPELIGRPVVLVGTADLERWERGFRFEGVTPLGVVAFPGIPPHRQIRLYTATRYLGESDPTPQPPADTTPDTRDDEPHTTQPDAD